MVNHYTKQLSEIIPEQTSRESIKFKLKINSVQQRISSVFLGYWVIVILISLFWIENFTERVNLLCLVMIDLSVNVLASEVVLKSKEIKHLKTLEIGYLSKTVANAMVRLTMQVYLGREVPIWMLNMFALLTLTHTSYFRKKVLFANFVVIIVSNIMSQFISYRNALEIFESGGKLLSYTHVEKQTPANFKFLWDSNNDRILKLMEPVLLYGMVIFIGFVYEDLVEQQYDETISSRIALVNQTELNKSKTKFISNLSHELRNPLHGLLITVELMKLETEKIVESINNIVNFQFESIEKMVNRLQNDLKGQIEFLNDVECNSKILIDVFSNYLQITNLELGKAKLNISSFNILELTDSITSVFTNLAKEKGLILQSIIDFRNVPLFLKGDHVKLSQILINLISNSIKYTKKGNVMLSFNVCDPVNEECPIKPIKSQEDTIYLKIVCQDTGIGISQQDIRNLFQPLKTTDGASVDFERYYSESIVKKNGDTFHQSHGIGLSISKQFIELMNGTIQVESDIGKGTKMTVYLPFSTCASLDNWKTNSRVEGKIEEIKKVSIKNIVILEQDEYFARMIEKMCKCIYSDSSITRISNIQSMNSAAGNNTKIFELDRSSQCKNIIFYPSQSDIFTKESISTFPLTSCLTFSTSLNYSTSTKLPTCDISLPIRIEQLISTIHSKISSTICTPTSSIPISFSHSKKVLVVDDNQVNRKVLQKMTRILGLESQEACDGLEAFELFKKEMDFDLILLDLLMPVLCGKECCKLIRSIEKGRKCKIVAVTANVWESDESLIKDGFDLVLKKPILMKELTRELEKLFE